MQEQNGGSIFRACFSIKNGESVTLHGAIRDWVFHCFFLLLSVHDCQIAEHERSRRQCPKDESCRLHVSSDPSLTSFASNCSLTFARQGASREKTKSCVS